ncbi:hypothetical protein HID58_060306 [Brassica napus]|uniref:Uncharacterized protein n=1 Tax=Brassica napus TaxID=3708 RepID=A0ABQ7ZVE7_BRANA|nr:hypothetical protein HID58_060306 [Brassica napus]
MCFVHNTTISISNHVNDDMFLSLVDFQLVMSETLQACFLIDVVGEVVELGELETIQCSGKPRRKLEYHLQDIKSDPPNILNYRFISFLGLQILLLKG